MQKTPRLNVGILNINPCIFSDGIEYTVSMGRCLLQAL